MDGLLDGRYRLGARLGRGGAAEVYEAEDLRMERKVAVKVYRPVGDDIGLRRFLVEAELLAGLSHPGLLTVYDINVDGDRPYLVMQLVAGGTLRQQLNKAALTPAATAMLGVELADVLAYVHANDVVHRDVKPSNVLFDSTGGCHLADFGIARALGAAHLTDSGEIIGTAAYLAPEQVVDRETGPPADVYALGLVLLECMTGEPEYSGTDVEMAVARLSRLPRIPDTLPMQWQTVLTGMTAFEPHRRPDARRCAKLLRALTHITVRLPRPAPRSRRGVYATLCALGVAGAAAAVVLTGGATELPGRLVGDPASGRRVGDPASLVPRTVAPVVGHGTTTATTVVTVVPAAPPPAAPAADPTPQQENQQGGNGGNGKPEKEKQGGKGSG